MSSLDPSVLPEQSRATDMAPGPCSRTVCFATVLIVNFVIHDGESNWLQGLMLLVVYILVAIAFIEHNTEDKSGHHPVFCWEE
jgi:hypothetical protein